MNVSEFIQRSDLFAVRSCNRGGEQLHERKNVKNEMLRASLGKMDIICFILFKSFLHGYDHTIHLAEGQIKLRTIGRKILNYLK